MKRLHFAFLLTLMLLLGWSHSRASHILGGEIAFSRIGPQAYHLQLVLYRDCSGAMLAGQSQQISLAQVGTTNTTVATLNQVSMATEVNNCAGLVTYCMNTASTIPGVEKYTFQGIVTVPVANVDYELEYNMCCRASAITNLAAPTTEMFVIKALLRDGVNQNSAVFDPLAQPFVCTSQANTLSFHATDADGDSLVYSLIPADGDLAPVVYAAGASFTQPILNAPTQTFNPATGLFSFNTATNQYAVVAVRVDEYRAGNLVGSVQRDLTSMIVPCQVTCGTNIIQGKVFRDNDQDCLSSSGDQNMPGWLVRLDPGPYFYPTNLNGDYAFAVTAGNHTVSAVLPTNGYWNVDCPATGAYTVNFPATGGSAMNQDFALNPTILCAEMWIDIGSSVIRPCSNTVYHVQYCNQGTDTAWNAYATVDLDANLTYISSTATVASSSNNSFQFNLGDLAPGQCGSFSITALVACNNNLLNQTMCAEAHIYPDSVCQPVSGAWDRSSITVSGACQDSVVCFTVLNTGSPSNGNMTGSTPWRLYENGTLVQSGSIQLCGGCDTTLCFSANGNTLRLEVDQRPGHPGNSHPNASVELCGTPGNTVGLINAMPQDDEDLFVSIDCRIVTNSYDPNHKSVVPSGLTDTYHYIDSTDALEYLVDFQNLGTGPAYDVVIEDVLDARLDLSTLQMGASSHPYTYTILPGPKLRVEFKSIILPAATTDRDASMGWFKYAIKQNPGNQFGDQIHNRADIYFDFNAPVLTNITENTIGWPEVVAGTPAVTSRNLDVKVFPNPSQGDARMRVDGLPAGTSVQVRVMNMLGQVKAEFTALAGQDEWIRMANPVSGVYFLEIRQGGKMLGAARFVVE